MNFIEHDERWVVYLVGSTRRANRLAQTWCAPPLANLADPLVDNQWLTLASIPFLPTFLRAYYALHKPLLILTFSEGRTTSPTHCCRAEKWFAMEFTIGLSVEFAVELRSVVQFCAIPTDLNLPFWSSKIVNLLCKIRIIRQSSSGNLSYWSSVSFRIDSV